MVVVYTFKTHKKFPIPMPSKEIIKGQFIKEILIELQAIESVFSHFVTKLIDLLQDNLSIVIVGNIKLTLCRFCNSCRKKPSFWE